MEGATIDLDWSALSADLAERVVAAINTHLASMTSRPSYIGPITVSSLDFGTNPPEVELVDVRDIYRDFLEHDEVEEEIDEHHRGLNGSVGRDGDFEWISRREGSQYTQTTSDVGGYGTPYNYLPPHVRPGASSSAEFLLQRPGLHDAHHKNTKGHRGRQIGMSVPDPCTPPRMAFPIRPPASSDSSEGFPNGNREAAGQESILSFPYSDPSEPAGMPPSRDETIDEPPPPDSSTQPSVQLHLRITFESNLRLTLSTSLQINYPSPLFMALPIKLSIIGLVFQGEVVAAYEGDRRRVHLCILDDQDPYCPAAIRTLSPSHTNNTPSDPENQSSTAPDVTTPLRARPDSPLAPVGARLLPSIFIESEIGQQDKHVLKNVSRVERFVQDVIRKTIEEELVFPNFMTLILDGGS